MDLRGVRFSPQWRTSGTRSVNSALRFCGPVGMGIAALLASRKLNSDGAITAHTAVFYSRLTSVTRGRGKVGWGGVTTRLSGQTKFHMGGVGTSKKVSGT